MLPRGAFPTPYSESSRMDHRRFFGLLAHMSFMLLAMVTAWLPTISNAADPYREPHGRHFDGSTLCRWKRTWHGPNANWTPLSSYSIPRPADPCLPGNRYYGCKAVSYATAVDFAYFAPENSECAYADSAALQPGLERLGHVPNDLGIAGALAEGPPRASQ